jgi:hypothetical protein
MVKQVGSCVDIAEVEDYAVPGDGVDEKLKVKKEELKCK